MRVVSLSVVLVAFSASAFAQNLMSSQGSFVPSVAEADRQINIPIKTENGETILVPLKLALSKQEKSSNSARNRKIYARSFVSFAFMDLCPYFGCFTTDCF